MPSNKVHSASILDSTPWVMTKEESDWFYGWLRALDITAQAKHWTQIPQ